MVAGDPNSSLHAWAADTWLTEPLLEPWRKVDLKFGDKQLERKAQQRAGLMRSANPEADEGESPCSAASPFLFWLSLRPQHVRQMTLRAGRPPTANISGDAFLGTLRVVLPQGPTYSLLQLRIKLIIMPSLKIFCKSLTNPKQSSEFSRRLDHLHNMTVGFLLPLHAKNDRLLLFAPCEGPISHLTWLLNQTVVS